MGEIKILQVLSHLILTRLVKNCLLIAKCKHWQWHWQSKLIYQLFHGSIMHKIGYSEIVHEHQLLFAWLGRLDCPISVAKISIEIKKNHTLAYMIPNFVFALKIDIVLLSLHARQKGFLHCTD